MERHIPELGMPEIMIALRARADSDTPNLEPHEVPPEWFATLGSVLDRSRRSSRSRRFSLAYALGVGARKSTLTLAARGITLFAAVPVPWP